MSSPSFELLVQDATSVTRAGWDFSYLDGRTMGGDLPWSYPDLARPLIAGSSRLLDQDTGGGEMLASLAPLPRYSVATEAWELNVPLAQQRLEPFGVDVRRQTGSVIPGADGEFDLVLNRHGDIKPEEIARVLADDGRLFTQQVGAGNDRELNHSLGQSEPDGGFTADSLAEALERAGLRVARVEQVAVPFTFLDIGAVVFQLLTVPWQIPGFTLAGFDAELRALDRQIRADGGFTVHNQRILLMAVKD